MKKKIFLVCLIFIFYHAACIAVNVIPSLFDIQTWYIDTESTFGNKSRIFLYGTYELQISFPVETTVNFEGVVYEKSYYIMVFPIDR